MTGNTTSSLHITEKCLTASEDLKTETSDEKQVIATQNAFAKITNKIRRSTDFSVICETVTQEMLKLLEADRVAIYQFNPDWSGQFTFESAGEEWVSLVQAQEKNALIAKNVSSCSVKQLSTDPTADTHLQLTYGGAFVQGEIFRVCQDIEKAGFSDCYIEVLKSYQARAYIIVAIYLDNQLWGLLAAYQNAGPRQWKNTEIQLLVQAAEQLGIALKQAEYVQTIQAQNNELQTTLQHVKEAQAQLVSNEKMASLGQLVAGIAHEINNPINFIHANLPHVERYMDDLMDLAQLRPENLAETGLETTALAAAKREAVEANSAIDINFMLEDLPKMLSSLKSGSARIRDIVQSLRNFSRLDESGIKSIDLHEGIDSTLVMLNRQLAASHNHPKIQVIKDYGSVSAVKCDPAQINQVILAVLTNAIDSLKGSYQINNKNPQSASQDPQILINTCMNPSNQVVIRIQDNGSGIEENKQSKVFDHFFTTKPVGKGTGLGLAIARQIIEDNHSGTLSLETEWGQGATFIIQLPVNGIANP